ALFESQRRQGFRAKGKLGYLPPEQVAGRPVDQRGDVFAAAVVIAELLLGRPLFGGGTEIGALLAIRDGDISPFRAIVHRLPRGLGQAVCEGLERAPENRTPTAAALRGALFAYVDEPIDRPRSALGALVTGAMDAARETAQRTSLARAIERDPSALEALTPVPEPIREEPPRYQLERGTGRVRVLGHAELVRAITT